MYCDSSTESFNEDKGFLESNYCKSDDFSD